MLTVTKVTFPALLLKVCRHGFNPCYMQQMFQANKNMAFSQQDGLFIDIIQRKFMITCQKFVKINLISV